MLYWVLVEHARHEHMSDEYNDRYIIQCCRSPHPGSIGATQDPHIMVSTELTRVGGQADKQRISQIRIGDRLLKLS